MKLTFEELIEEIREIAIADVKQMADHGVNNLVNDLTLPYCVTHDKERNNLQLHHIIDAIWGAAIAEKKEREEE